MTDTSHTSTPTVKTRQTKICSVCRKRKAIRSKFRWMPTRNAYHPWCRDCERESTKLRSQR